MPSFTPRYANLVTMLRESIARFAERPFFGVRGSGTWHWHTYGEVGKMIDACRAGLAGLGVAAGDRVAVISNNRLEWALGSYATHGLGAAYVPMYENQLDKEWQYIIGDSGAKVVLVGSAVAERRIRALLPELPTVRHVVGFDDSGETGFARLLETGAKTPVPPVEPQGRDMAAIVYTSGTTGHPKGVCLSHENLASNVQASQMVIPFTTEDRTVGFLPWAHVFGGNVEMNTIMCIGASMAICESPDKLLEIIAEVHPTILVAVPRIWNKIHGAVLKSVATQPKPFQRLFARAMAAASRQRSGQKVGVVDRIALAIARRTIFAKVIARFGGRLKFAISGAAALSREVAEFVDNLGIMVFEGYGMTESSGAATASAPTARRIGAVGKPIPGVTIALDHTAVGADETQGEILIKGHCVMMGYYGKPDETRATLTEDGALRTGDLGKIDGDGFLYITGRVKELYKLENGKYVAPAPLEEQITLSPFVAQVMVHGANRPYNVALIVPDMGALKEWGESHGVAGDKLLEDERVTKLIADELARHSGDFKGFERVQKFALIGEEFTTANDMLTPTLKVKRRNVMKRYEDRIASLYQQ
jgi:long-chain acyl-CoA synthetase